MFKPSQPRFTLTLAMAAFAAAAALSAPAHAASATATASGTVVTPIAIAVSTNLAFGSFTAAAAGNVTVSTSGARTTTGPILIGTGSSAARFNITGQANATYSIVHTGTTVLTNTTGGDGETMALSKFSDLTGANATSGDVSAGLLDGTGAQSLYVGGTLSVGAGQVPGLYTGNVIATVEYN